MPANSSDVSEEEDNEDAFGTSDTSDSDEEERKITVKGEKGAVFHFGK